MLKRNHKLLVFFFLKCEKAAKRNWPISKRKIDNKTSLIENLWDIKKMMHADNTAIEKALE